MKHSTYRVTAKRLSSSDEAKLAREVDELSKLSTEELRAMARPLTAGEKARWERTRRGRPKKPPGTKAARVLFTIEPALLKQADQFARSHGLTRAELIATGLRTVMSA
jgi:hypothetical protein